MRRAVIAVAVVLVFLGFAPVPARAEECSSKYAHCVSITDSAFAPSAIRIPVNGDLFWCPDNDNAKTHNVHFPGSFVSRENIPPGSGCIWHTFQDAGTFNYQCDLVPGMTGTVVVGDGAPATSVTSPPNPSSTAPTVRRATATTSRPTAASHGTSLRAVATTSATAEVTPITEAAADDTTTTAGQVAIREASSGKSSRGSTAAVIASLAMLVAGGGYVLYRRREPFTR
jgi:plastocyanin